MTVGEITDAVREAFQDRNRHPSDNEIRGRLSTLTKEGILTRPERGRYALVRRKPEMTDALERLVDILTRKMRDSSLRRTVLWDATPYLELAADGGPGTRLVVEHKSAASVQDEVEVAWPDDEPVATWCVKKSGPLGPRLIEPDNLTPYRLSDGVVFVEREKFGATGLTPGGYRTPFPERVLVEFLGQDGPPETSSIVRTLLQDPDVRLDRLWAAAETLGVIEDVTALLAGVGMEVGPQMRADFVSKLSPVTRTLIEGER